MNHTQAVNVAKAASVVPPAAAELWGSSGIAAAIGALAQELRKEEPELSIEKARIEVRKLCPGLAMAESLALKATSTGHTAPHHTGTAAAKAIDEQATAMMSQNRKLTREKARILVRQARPELAQAEREAARNDARTAQKAAGQIGGQAATDPGVASAEINRLAQAMIAAPDREPGLTIERARVRVRGQRPDLASAEHEAARAAQRASYGWAA